ncbi:hypothetical protein Nmel_014285 [Mimus melanotis]
MEFLHLCIMLNQKSQDITMPDGIVKVVFSQEQFTQPDCFFSIFRVNSRKGQKGSVTAHLPLSMNELLHQTHPALQVAKFAFLFHRASGLCFGKALVCFCQCSVGFFIVLILINFYLQEEEGDSLAPEPIKQTPSAVKERAVPQHMHHRNLPGAVSNLLQQLPPGLLREILGLLGDCHLLSQLLGDDQVLLQAELQSFMVLMGAREQRDVANTIMIHRVCLWCKVQKSATNTSSWEYSVWNTGM